MGNLQPESFSKGELVTWIFVTWPQESRAANKADIIPIPTEHFVKATFIKQHTHFSEIEVQTPIGLERRCVSHHSLRKREQVRAERIAEPAYA